MQSRDQHLNKNFSPWFEALLVFGSLLESYSHGSAATAACGCRLHSGINFT